MKKFSLFLISFILILGCVNASKRGKNADNEKSLSHLSSLYKGINLGLTLDVPKILELTLAEQAKVISDLKEAQIGLVRVEFNAHTKDNVFIVGETRKIQYLDFINTLKRNGINTILLFDYMSYKSHGEPQGDGTLVYDSAQIQQFLNAIIGNDQALLPTFYRDAQVRIFEIWNEPNFTWRVNPHAMAQALNYIYK